MTIAFYFETWVKLKQRRLLKQFIQELVLKEGAQIQALNFIFCSDIYLLEINSKFLKHAYYTDIITFDLKEKPTDKSEGEVYISVDRVRENATKFSTTAENEMYRVIIHGVLHLCGYKDKKTAEKNKMREKENYYLKKYGSYVSRET